MDGDDGAIEEQTQPELLSPVGGQIGPLVQRNVDREHDNGQPALGDGGIKVPLEVSFTAHT